MSDIRHTNKFVVVKNGSNVFLSQFYESARVETPHTQTGYSSLNGIPLTNLPAIPATGQWCELNQMYVWNNQVVCCRQGHNRTIYDPPTTPALWSFYQGAGSNLAWIENEMVEVNWQRTYQGTNYKVLQAHMTQQAWNPVATLGVLWGVVHVGNYWAVGVAYKVNDIVIYQPNGLTYKCLQAHTSQAGWTPPAVPALWQLIS